jgi:pimeloyl-ACP methyl ester carboxylesterase
MPFIASNGLTEEATRKTVAAGMPIHYHDLGTGDPVVFLHSYGPGPTAWITFHKAVGELSRHYRCVLMDLPNFSKTGPIVYREGVHSLQARTAVALLDALGIERAHWVGNSQGGQSAMVAAINYPDRVVKFVMGGSHIGTGRYTYWPPALRGQPRHPTGDHRPEPREHSPLSARPHRRRDARYRRAGGPISIARIPGRSSLSRRARNR